MGLVARSDHEASGKSELMKSPDDEAPSPIMTAAEVAEFLQVHVATLYRLLKQGQIPVFKIGTEYRFDRKQIEKWTIDRQPKIWYVKPKGRKAKT